LRATRVDLNEGLKDGLRTVAGGARHGRIRAVLVVGEVALTATLLAGSGLMIRSFQRLMEVDAGFNANGVLTMQVDLPDSRYPIEQKAAAFFDDILKRIAAIPGVLSAGATSQLPLRPGINGLIQIEGRPQPETAFSTPLVQPTFVTLDYFKTMSIPVRAGRNFSKADGATSKEVVIINEALARQFWPGENPIGKRLSWSQAKPDWREVAGIVADTHEQEIAKPPMPEVFFPYAQASGSSMTIVVRSRIDAAAVANEVREQLAKVDPELPLYEIREMKNILSASTAVTRFQALLMGLLGALALALAGAGIYSVISYGVSQRTQEIGIRKSLGASRADLLKLIVGNGMLLVLVGAVIGLGASLALSRLMSGLLFGVSPRDPLTFVVLIAAVAVVGLLACLIPALRAMRIEPVAALRYE
ncbi:MAG TPA: FtsX-like permease family protein, partial [Blastocatellia bacterium]|nr:FtsX-like permease family protein [Blastocatellia bacterium]